MRFSNIILFGTLSLSLVSLSTLANAQSQPKSQSQ